MSERAINFLKVMSDLSTNACSFVGSSEIAGVADRTKSPASNTQKIKCLRKLGALFGFFIALSFVLLLG